MPRPVGSANRQTILREEIIHQAQEAMLKEGVHPVDLLMEMARWLKGAATLRATRRRLEGESREDSEREAQRYVIAMAVEELKLVDRLMRSAADMLGQVMAVTHPRLSVIEHSGKDGGPIEYKDASAIEYIRGRLDSIAERSGTGEPSSRPH